jgi:hypothetical protein
MRHLALLALLLVGCASAKLGGGGDDDGTPGDGNNNGNEGNNVDIDAPPPIDAAVSTTLSQTGTTNIVATEIGCQVNDGSRITTENSYYRIFPLSDHNITTSFSVTEVAFAVERATAGGGAASQPAQVKIGTYSGTLNATSFAVASLTPLASATIQIPNNTANVVVPISMFSPSSVTVPPSAMLYAEVFIPDGRPTGNIFYIGSNGGTETHPSYIRASDCQAVSPTQYAALVPTPLIRLLITVTGVH